MLPLGKGAILMEIVELQIGKPIAPIRGLSLALGNFDGFHKGHQRLLLEAKFHGLYSGVLLFDPPPSSFLSPGPSLMGLDDKERFASSMGIDYCIVLKTNKDFVSMPPDSFLAEVIDKIGPESLVVGEDFRFGQGAKGDVSSLKRKYKTYVCKLLSDSSGKISTSRIKGLLLEGKVKEAWGLLGHPYEIRGKTVKGLQNGRKIGFPTLNLSLPLPYVLPKEGVYAGICYLGGMPYKAMINVGDNPSVDGPHEKHVEVHLLGYSGSDDYDKTAYVDFLCRVRDERKFASLGELKEQLKEDKKAVEGLLE